jgi:hypothetical protein
MQVLELIPHTREPITENGSHVLTGTAITFQNTGNATATLNNHFTIQPGQTFQLAAGSERESIINGRFSIRFGAGNNPRLEVLYLIPNAPQFNNYEQQ